MAEHQIEPLNKPVLRPHRLIPAPGGAVPADGLPIAAVEQEIEGWRAASEEPVVPALAQGGRALAEQAWLLIEKAARTLDALPAIFKGMNAPEEVFETLELIGSILLALPDQMASGRDASVARTDWMFSRLLNAPAQPGLIEQVIEALAALDQSKGTDEEAADYAAEFEVLRCLHRDLVSLQQRWDDLIDAVFPINAPPPAPASSASASQARPVGSAAAARTSPPLPKVPAPLPTGLRVAPSLAGGPPARAFRFPAAGKQRLGMLAALLLLLVLAATGVLFVQSRNGSAIDSNGSALSVNQHKSLVPTQVQPTPTQPVPTPTPKPPTPTPRPPTPTPRPPSSKICPNGAAFCVSTLQLQVPCAGQGSATFQLMGNTPDQTNWQAVALSNFGGSLVTLAPTHGALKQGQTVTITVQAATQRTNRSGTIMIFGPFNTSPISIAVRVCA